MNTFPSPFPPQPEAPGTSPLKPFTAVDLAPQGAGPGQAPNPFLDNYQGPYHEGNPAPARPAAPTLPVANGKAPGTPAPGPAYPGTAAPKPFPAPQANPSAPPAAARSTQIMAASEFPAAVSGASFKPKFFLTTTASVEGFPIQDYLGVVSAEIVVPKDLLLRNPAPYGELHRIKYAEDYLQQIRVKVLEELAERAKQAQADGLVGVTVQFSQMDALVSLCSAVGTAVRVAS